MIHDLLFRLRSLFRRNEADLELNDELRSHLEHEATKLMQRGQSRAEALRQAQMAFGGVEQVKEECRESRGIAFFQTLLADVRYSLRLLRRSPGLTIVAVLTLALGIGANSVVIAVLNALILHPLNLPQEESLYAIQHGKDNTPSESYPDYVDIRDHNHSFDGLAGYDITQAGLTTGKNISTAWVYEVSGNYFDVLGVQPYLGRFFHGSDEHGPNSAPYIVLAYSYWHTHFQDDRGVVGRVVQLSKHPFTILGVAPPEFHGTIVFLSPDLFVPMINREQVQGSSGLDARGRRWIHLAMGHLKPGVTPDQAIADLNSIGAYLEKTYPADDTEMKFSLSRPGLLGDVLGRPIRAFMTGLMMLAGLILLAACANLGSLFAAHAADRSREVALKLALGSSRKRILRQLFIEALLISLLGGALGLWGSLGLVGALSRWHPSAKYPVNLPVHPEANVYVMALLLALASGFLFAAVPVGQVLRTNPFEIVKAGTSGRGGHRISVRDLLLLAQIAICAVLVTSSMVAVRGMARSLHSNFGFEPRSRMLADTDLNMAGYGSDSIPAMQKRMVDALRAIPGVQSVGLVDRAQLSGDTHGTLVFTDQTSDFRSANATTDALVYSISPEYLRAAGTALLSGRSFTEQDDQAAPRVALINGEFARKVFGSLANAVEKYYKLPDGTRIHVVGIVEDGKYQTLTEDSQAVMFLPILQAPSSKTCLVVHSTGDSQQLAAAMKHTLEGLNAGLPFFIETWNQLLDGVALFPSRLASLTLGVLGFMAAMLAVTGIFGMAAYSVSKRMRELGIRVALGAQSKNVLRAALGRALKLLAVGSAAGLLLGVLASRVLSAIVYQATSRDPLVLTGVVVAMALLGLLATWVPARRALKVDPLLLLREE